MTDYERKPGADDSTTDWPYHSDLHDYIIAQMRLHSGPAPLPPHVQNAHALAGEHAPESLDDELERAEQDLAASQLATQSLQTRVNDLRLAQELHRSADELPV